MSKSENQPDWYKELSGVLQKLSGADRRSIGRADEVVPQVLGDPHLMDDIVSGLTVEDPVIRMRAADVMEKVSGVDGGLIQPYKSKLLKIAAQATQQEVCWHMAQVLPRLRLTASERKAVFDLLLGYLDHRSKIVKTFTMQALADLALTDPSLRQAVTGIIKACIRNGSPAMQSRGRKLLKGLQ